MWSDTFDGVSSAVVGGGLRLSLSTDMALISLSEIYHQMIDSVMFSVVSQSSPATPERWNQEETNTEIGISRLIGVCVCVLVHAHTHLYLCVCTYNCTKREKQTDTEADT